MDDENLPERHVIHPKANLPAVLGGLSLPFLSQSAQALAAPGAGRIAGRATDIPPPPPPSNSRIERSVTPSSSSDSRFSFEFGRAIPKIRIQDGDLLSNDRVLVHGRPIRKTDVAVFGGFMGVAIAQAEMARRRERLGQGGVEGDVYLVTYQVAMYDRDQRGLMPALQRLAERAETTTSAGLASLASSVSLELLRSYEGWVAAQATSGRFKDMAAAERAFNEASMRERKKWAFENTPEDRAAMVEAARRKGNGSKESSAASSMAGKQLLVLTLMVACRNIGGKHILPRRSGSAEALEGSLERFAAALLEKNGKNVLAVDVSWTPDGDGEILSRLDVTRKWPELIDL
ncbi:hypothetical protein NSK_004838 [Nannochloropsis salina CCMP1776]|uniref:Uncharacterized protein n=1 Tax=Nannochloropsis salina CCMP1776 TaxID=1027361 RepID=A0A4D9CYY4_9STRA|nr:hypothetical protein NSK_004838 [Nannochloropsis salina CCMP1776]|eukprot:TFJ83734.1 hypothetical protein NSK_004838 [Nannochloropsis salina CCMP1776]